MYPPSPARALATQLATERAISELAQICLDEWLPRAESAVLRAAAEPPPNPAAASDTQHEWDYLVDAVIVYGIGLITAHAISTAYSALTGGLLAAGDAAAATFWKPLQFNLPGLPTLSSLQRRADEVLSRRLRFDPSGVNEWLMRTPEVRTPVTSYVTNLRSRITDVVGRVYRKTSPAASSEAFTPEEWSGVTEEIGRGQATPALNTATAAAGHLAAGQGNDLEQTWVSILDTHTRPAHALADGQTVPFGAMFDVGGELLRFPADPRGSIENIANCRCHMFVSVAGEGLTAASDRDILKPGAEETTMGMYRSFSGVLAVIGTPTDDGRMFAEDIRLAFRDFPLPLLWQKQSDVGHFSSYTVGAIESAHIEGTQIVGTGYLLNTPEADEAAVQVEHGLTGPSVDLGDTEWEIRDENGRTITEEELWDLPMDAKLLQVVLAAKVLAATLVSTPAFGQTSITLGDMVERGSDAPAALVAAGVAYEPPVFPFEFFTDPLFEGPMLPHMTADGRIQGHLAVWNVCHTGIQDRCVMAPHSATEYSWFHTSPPVQTSSGQTVRVGRLTVGGGHAAPSLGVGPAVAHYDDTGTCFALVHVGEDPYGIWFSGVPAPGASAEQIARGLAAPLSGDWRMVGGNLELVAALAVNTPGFPIVASGATDEHNEPLSLVAAIGPCRESADGPQMTEAQLKMFVQCFKAVRAAEKRDARAREIIGGYNRRRASALVARVDTRS